MFDGPHNIELKKIMQKNYITRFNNYVCTTKTVFTVGILNKWLADVMRSSGHVSCQVYIKVVCSVIIRTSRRPANCYYKLKKLQVFSFTYFFIKVYGGLFRESGVSCDSAVLSLIIGGGERAEPCLHYNWIRLDDSWFTIEIPLRMIR